METIHRKCTLVMVMCVAIIFASFGLAHHTYAAHAGHTTGVRTITCSRYVVDRGARRYTQIVIGYGYRFSLWYNSCTNQNYASLNTLGKYATGRLSVERANGPDGKDSSQYITFNGRGLFTTPGVYAPRNAARACFQNNASNRTQCTPWTDRI